MALASSDESFFVEQCKVQSAYAVVQKKISELIAIGPKLMSHFTFAYVYNDLSSLTEYLA